MQQKIILKVSKILRVNLLTTLLLLSQPSSVLADSNVVKILPLGDSITHAEINQLSYRYPLWKLLIDEGVEVDFVGSMNTRLSGYSEGEAPQPSYKGVSFDVDHEGHFGWRVDDILNGRNSRNGTGSGRLAEWMKSYDFDIALVHLGSNDAFYRESNQQVAGELKAVVTTLREDNPKVVILLAKLIPTSRNMRDASAVAVLNEVMPPIAKEMTSESSPIIVVDQFAGFKADVDTYDGVHPNKSGELKMAKKWFKAIKSVLPRLQLPRQQ